MRDAKVPKKAPPPISTVSAANEPCTLHFEWQSGFQSLVEVSALIKTFRVYESLRHNPHLFQKVQTGEFGTDVC